MRLRLPSVDHGVVSFAWGVVLGAYVWGGLLAIGTSAATAFVVGVLSIAAIFLYVRIYGDDSPAAGSTPQARPVAFREGARKGGEVRFFRQVFLGFVASALMLPGAVAFATVLLVLTAPDKEGKAPHFAQWNSFLNRTPARACLYGALLAVGFCLVLALVVCRRFARANSACPGPFDQLRQGFDEAQKRLAAAPVDVKGTEAWHEADGHIEYLKTMFAPRAPVGLAWLLGTGYIDGWRRLHGTDEALLRLEDRDVLLRNAFDDESRLQGSTIPESATLLKRLRLAVFSLSEAAANYLDQLPPPGSTSTSPEDARTALVQVRSSISEFRDGLREGLVRARNRLYATVVFAGITGCVLLYVAILGGATKKEIAAVSVFYLVGGSVGLVKQLQSASASEGAGQEDYGLGVVRLIHTPLFSGLAGVAGVVLINLTQGGPQGNQFSLTRIFNLNTNAYALLAAASFGLAPAALLSGLQRRIEQYKTDLSKSASSDAHKAATG